MTFNSRNMLTDVVTSDGAITVYGYDAENSRIYKTENGTATSYVVNNNAALSQVLMSTKNGKTTYYIYGLGLIAQEEDNVYKTYHYDYRGSTTAITDITGNVTDTVYYDAYGSIINRTGTTETPFLYVGQYGVETDENGLYYMRARYYNPQIQRFINVDPVRDEYNWYGYCDSNCISYIDPIGLHKIPYKETINGYSMVTDVREDFRVILDYFNGLIKETDNSDQVYIVVWDKELFIDLSKYKDEHHFVDKHYHFTYREFFELVGIECEFSTYRMNVSEEDERHARISYSFQEYGKSIVTGIVIPEYVGTFSKSLSTVANCVIPLISVIDSSHTNKLNSLPSVIPAGSYVRNLYEIPNYNEVFVQYIGISPTLNEDMDKYPKERYSWDREHTIHSYSRIRGYKEPL